MNCSSTACSVAYVSPNTHHLIHLYFVSGKGGLVGVQCFETDIERHVSIV